MVSEWRDIASAPKDGTLILAGWGGPEVGYHLFVTRWHDGRWDALDGEHHYAVVHFWTPIPPLPATTPQHSDK
jgi:hypothetical protein